MLTELKREHLCFHSMANWPNGVALAMMELLRLGHTIKPAADRWEGPDLVFKVATPNGTVKVTVIETGWEYIGDGEYESYEGLVQATVGGRTISEDSFLRMVGAV